MEVQSRALRSQSSRRGRVLRPLDLHLCQVLTKDLSLPSIDNSMYVFSPERVRSKTPSTESTSPTEVTHQRLGTAPAVAKMPVVSARSWVICAGESGEVLSGVNYLERREVASLTKIMTCYVVLRLTKRLPGVCIKSTVRVSRMAAMMTGTTADLCEGEEGTVWDLLHGLMLPSGNDAAYSLAEHFGKLLHDVTEGESPSRNYVRYFLQKMNQYAKKLKMNQTAFDNPHGLANPTNRSTAKDIAKLTSVCMKMSKFREIVRTKCYSSTLSMPAFKSYRRISWQNTNKLLDADWLGVKTGVTPTAGPCLSVCYRVEKRTIIIVMLACASMERRWTDAVLLATWAKERIRLDNFSQ